jgi:hypothetical protein
MTKITATSALPASVRKPVSINVLEQQRKAFQLASALIRKGYVFLPDRQIEFYSQSNTVGFTMILGEPEETGYADAEAAMLRSLEHEAALFEERVEREVGIRVEQLQHAANEAKKAALLAEHRKQVAQIEAVAAAEIAKLSIKQ